MTDTQRLEKKKKYFVEWTVMIFPVLSPRGMQTALSIQVNCDLPRLNSSKYSSGLADCNDVLFFFDGGAWHLLLPFFEYAHSCSSLYYFSLPNAGSYPNNTGIPCCDLTLIGANSCLHIPPPLLFCMQSSRERGGEN